MRGLSIGVLLFAVLPAQTPAPLDAAAQAKEAMALFDAGKYRASLQALDRCLAVTTDRADLWRSRGIARSRCGDRRGALADLERALGLAPRDVSALIERGRLRASHDELDGATADFEAVLAIDDKSTAALIGRGEVRRQRGDLDGALADFTAVLASEPQNAAALRDRAEVQRARGAWLASLDDYDRAIRLLPAATMLQCDRAEVHFRRGRPEVAFDGLDRLVHEHADDATLRWNTALLRLRAGDAERAAIEFGELVAHGGADVQTQAQQLLGWSQLAAGHDAQALAAVATDRSQLGALLRWCARARADGLAGAVAELPPAGDAATGNLRAAFAVCRDGSGDAAELTAAKVQPPAAAVWTLFASAWRAQCDGRADAARTKFVRVLNTGDVAALPWAVTVAHLRRAETGLAYGFGVTIDKHGDGGLVVTALARESAARDQGLLPGDRIATVQGEAATLAAWDAATARPQPGQTVVLTIRRGSETIRRAIVAGIALD